MNKKIVSSKIEQDIEEVIHQTLTFCKNDEYFSEWEFLFDSKRSNCARLLWAIIIGFSCVVCCYQIYERIDYFQSNPVSTNVQVQEVQRVTFPGVSISNLDTETLKPYWPKDSDLTKNIVKCSLPCSALIQEPRARKNLTKFWLALSNLKNLEKIYIDYNGNLLNGISYINTSDNSNDNSNDFKILEEFSYDGTDIVIHIKSPVRIGSKINLEIKKLGLCDQQMLTSSIIDNYTRLRYEALNQFPAFSTTTISIIQYSFLNRQNEECESDDKITQNCFNQCLLKKYEQLQCRFPFMPPSINLTNCGLEQSSEEIYKTLKEITKFLIFISLTKNCNCVKPCLNIIFKTHTQTKRADDENYIILQYHFNDPYSILFKEIKDYDVNWLLIDIAGNVGLFFGFSILSLLQLGYISGLNIYNRLNKKHSKQLHNFKLYNYIKKLSKSMTECQTSEKIYFFNVLNKMIVVTCAMLTMYTMKERVNYFMTYPVNVLVVLKDENLVYFPNLIACADASKILMWRKKKSKELNIPKCKTQFLDLLKINGGEKSLMKLWKERIINIDKITLQAIYSVTGLTDQVVNYTPTAFIDGDCQEFSFKPTVYSGTSSLHVISFQEIKNDCNDGLATLYVRPKNAKIYSILKSEINFYPNIRGRIVIRTIMLTRFNSNVHKCTDSTISKHCIDKCYEAKIKKLIKCRLPFMTLHRPFCNNATDAKEASNTYIEIAMTTDAIRECNCLLPCDEKMYQVFVYLDEHGSLHSFQKVIAFSNYVENFIEVEAYNIVALLCDFGNCFGLILGLCLLTFFHTIHITLINVKNQIMSNWIA